MRPSLSFSFFFQFIIHTLCTFVIKRKRMSDIFATMTDMVKLLIPWMEWKLFFPKYLENWKLKKNHTFYCCCCWCCFLSFWILMILTNNPWQELDFEKKYFLKNFLWKRTYSAWSRIYSVLGSNFHLLYTYIFIYIDIDIHEYVFLPIIFPYICGCIHI